MDTNKGLLLFLLSTVDRKQASHKQASSIFFPKIHDNTATSSSPTDSVHEEQEQEQEQEER